MIADRHPISSDHAVPDQAFIVLWLMITVASFAYQSPHDPTGIEANRCSDVQELQYVQAPIPALIFGHVGWWLAQPFRHNRLGKAGRLTPSYK
jgi:hypothetical protein